MGRTADCPAGRSAVSVDQRLATGHLERLLVEGLLLGQPHNYMEELAEQHRPAAPPSVREAIELMRSRPEHPWTTAALAGSVAVSARSLQDGFARSIGVPPTRYLREVRPDRVHEDLRSADAYTATVSQVAGRWGFLYLSRFAAAYREKFGESPSETLRRFQLGRHRADDADRSHVPCPARTTPNSALVA
jgi:transcriptional regulator GlxA family with amidase domain